MPLQIRQGPTDHGTRFLLTAGTLSGWAALASCLNYVDTLRSVALSLVWGRAGGLTHFHLGRTILRSNSLLDLIRSCGRLP